MDPLSERSFVRQARRLSRLALLAATFQLAACSEDISLSTPAVVESEIRTFVDTTRATAANRNYPGAPDRTLETTLWYLDREPRDAPACSSRGCALIVLAHGFTGLTERFDVLGRELASAGYIVASANFPLTFQFAPGGASIPDLVNQPADVSFVIDRVLAASAAEGDVLRGRVDSRRVGVVGHSLGGATVLGLTRSACCTDSRVGAVVAVAPVSALLPGIFGGTPAVQGPPTLLVSGSNDTVIQFAWVREYYDQIVAPRVFLQVTGAHHSDLIENYPQAGEFVDETVSATIAFFDEILGEEEGAIAPALAGLAAQGHPSLVDLGAR